MSESLTIQTEAAVAVAALTAGTDLARMPEVVGSLVDRGADMRDLREAAYVASLFCGFPRAVAALVVLDSLDPDGERLEEAATPDRAVAVARGEELFRRIHGVNADRQLVMLNRVHPDFAETVLAEAYGRVLARNGLDLETRELVGVACLAAEGLNRQLRAHLLGARNVGASWSGLEATLVLTEKMIDRALPLAFEELASVRSRGGQ